MLNTVLAADRVKEHLDRRMVEPTGEHPAVVGQDLTRRTERLQRATQPVTH